MDLQGEDPEVAHQFFDQWQDSLEEQYNEMLASHRPCHYAVNNGTGQVIWVPNYTPCWFEGHSGKLVIDMANGPRWLPPALQSRPGNLLHVGLSSSVSIEEAATAVPGLQFPRRQRWQESPVLELNLGQAPIADCCPLARVRIYTEELRALRTAIQLMVKRAEENAAQPVHQSMDPIQEGASEAGTDAHTEEDFEESTPQQTPQNSAEGRAPYGCVQVHHEDADIASPIRACGCFGFGGQNPIASLLGVRSKAPSSARSLDEESPSTPRVSEKGSLNREAVSSREAEALQKGVGSPDSHEYDSAMLFYHDPAVPGGQNGQNGHSSPHDKNSSRQEGSRADDSAMAFDALRERDRSSCDSYIHPARVDPFTGAPKQTSMPADNPTEPVPSPEAHRAPAVGGEPPRQKNATMPETNGAGAGNEKPQQEPADQKSLTKAQVKRPAVQEKDQQPQQQEHPEQESPRGDFLNGRAAEDEASLQQEPAEQKSATGASLPALLLSTAHAVVLSASHSFTSALPLAAHAFRGTYAFSAQQPSKENGDAERQLLDTARGPAGDYRNAHRAGQGNGGLPAGIKPHVWDAARMVAESQAACKEVWAPGYDHTPELSDSEEQTDAPAKAVQGSGIRVGPAKSTRWMPDSPIQAAGVPSKPQSLPESPGVKVPAEEMATVAADMGFANSALAPAGSRAGQVMGSQSSMLPSESRKLAHLALQVKEPSPEARATPDEIQRMRQALGRFPDGHAAGAQEVDQPAPGDVQLPMQPALSLTDWTTEDPSGHIPGKQQAALAPAADVAVAESKRDVKTFEAGNESSSDVDVDSPFAPRGSLPSKEGQRKIVNRYAGTSDDIFEDLNNPFDKYRGPPKARRNAVTRSSTNSKGSRGIRRKSSASSVGSPSRAPDLAGSPLSRLSQSASASETPSQTPGQTPLQSADVSRAASPQGREDIASHAISLHEHEDNDEHEKEPTAGTAAPAALTGHVRQPVGRSPRLAEAAGAKLAPDKPHLEQPAHAFNRGHTFSPDHTFSHDHTFRAAHTFQPANGQPNQPMPGQQEVALANVADNSEGQPARQQDNAEIDDIAPAAAAITAAGATLASERTTQPWLERVSQQGLALRDQPPPQAPTQPETAPVNAIHPPETAAVTQAQPGMESTMSETAAVAEHHSTGTVQPQHMEAAQGLSGIGSEAAPAIPQDAHLMADAPTGDLQPQHMEPDTKPEAASEILPEQTWDASERPSSPSDSDAFHDAVSVTSSKPDVTSPSVPKQAGASAPVLAGALRAALASAGGMNPHGAQEPKQAMSGSLATATSPGATESLLQAEREREGSVQSTDNEQHVAVSLRVRQPKSSGMVAAAIAALGLSSYAHQPSGDLVRVRMTPLNKSQSRSRVALNPDQLDASWFTGLLTSPSTSAAKPRQQSLASSPGSRAAEQSDSGHQETDRVAAAVARLAEAARAGPPGQPKEPTLILARAGASSEEGVAAGDSGDDLAAALPSPRATEHPAGTNVGVIQMARQYQEPAAQKSPLQNVARPTDASAPDMPRTSGAPAMMAEFPRQAGGVSASSQRSGSAAEDPQQKALPGGCMGGTADPVSNGSAAPSLTALSPLPAGSEAPSVQAPLARAVIKPRWERPDKAAAAATLGGGATLARCASDAAQQARMNRALVSELKQRLETAGPRPSAGQTAPRRKQSGQLGLGLGAEGSSQERGLLYKPELQSVADRVRYIERASSRDVPPFSAMTTQPSTRLPTAALPTALQEAA